MVSYTQEIKTLNSRRNDILKRIGTNDYNNPSNSIWKNAIQNKLNKFIIDIRILEEKIEQDPPEKNEKKKINEEIETLRKDAENIQQKLNPSKVITEIASKEDDILNSLTFLKEISNQILKELTAQNEKLEKNLRDAEGTNKIIIKNQEGSRTENILNYWPNTCLMTTMITQALVIIMLMCLL